MRRGWRRRRREECNTGLGFGGDGIPRRCLSLGGGLGRLILGGSVELSLCFLVFFLISTSVY